VFGCNGEEIAAFELLRFAINQWKRSIYDKRR
jgi:hypothetical protein